MAIRKFAVAYAEQAQRDHAALKAAVRSGAVDVGIAGRETHALAYASTNRWCFSVAARATQESHRAAVGHQGIQA